MTTVDFLTPVRFDGHSVYGCVDSVLEFAEDFCNFSESYGAHGKIYESAGKVAIVMAGRTNTGNIPVFQTNITRHIYPIWLKATICAGTIGIFSLLMLITKAVLRCFYTFEVVQKPSLLRREAPQPTPEQIQKQTERNDAINAFHVQAQITAKTPFQLIAINQSTFAGLDLNEEATITVREVVEDLGDDLVKYKTVEKTVSLGDVARLVVGQINETIIKKAHETQETLPACRFFNLPIYDELLKPYAHLGGPDLIRKPEEIKLRWIDRILTALVDAGQLFDFSLNGHGYWIQA